MDSKTNEILQKFSNQKIELTVQKELQRQISLAKNLIGDAEKVSNLAQEISAFAQTTLDSVDKVENALINLTEAVKNQTSEMGIKPTEVKGYEEAMKMWLEISGYQSYLQRVVKNARNIKL